MMTLLGLYHRAQWSWDGRIRSELHTDPRTMSLRDLWQSLYYLLSKQVNSEFGKILEHIEPPDPCADLSAEERADDRAAFEAEICNAKRIMSDVELNQWLSGLYDGRFWKPGWEPE